MSNTLTLDEWLLQFHPNPLIGSIGIQSLNSNGSIKIHSLHDMKQAMKMYYKICDLFSHLKTYSTDKGIYSGEKTVLWKILALHTNEIRCSDWNSNFMGKLIQFCDSLLKEKSTCNTYSAYGIDHDNSSIISLPKLEKGIFDLKDLNDICHNQNDNINDVKNVQNILIICESSLKCKEIAFTLGCNYEYCASASASTIHCADDSNGEDDNVTIADITDVTNITDVTKVTDDSNITKATNINKNNNIVTHKLKKERKFTLIPNKSDISNISSDGCDSDGISYNSKKNTNKRRKITNNKKFKSEKEKPTKSTKSTQTHSQHEIAPEVLEKLDNFETAMKSAGLSANTCISYSRTVKSLLRNGTLWKDIIKPKYFQNIRKINKERAKEIGRLGEHDHGNQSCGLKKFLTWYHTGEIKIGRTPNKIERKGKKD